MTDLSKMSLTKLIASLRDRSLSAQELAEVALSNMSLGAYISTNTTMLENQARLADSAFDAGLDLGPLQGVPVSVKDLFGVPGFATFAGSPKELPEKFAQSGPLVRTLLRQLGLITGKTHTVEFAFGGLGKNPHYPTPINPWDESNHRLPGGSTAGGGVSLCEGSALLAIGTDTAGSVRIPASWTGNVGLKTTKGRWSTSGVVPLSPTLDTVGILARTVEDLVIAFEELDPSYSEVPDPPDLSTIRAGRCETLLFEGCSKGVVEAIDGALSKLDSCGLRISEIELPELRPTYELFKQGGPVSAELYRFLFLELPDWLETLDPNVKSRMSNAATLPAYEYLERLRLIGDYALSIDKKLSFVDVILCPTVANSPPMVDEVEVPEGYSKQNLLSLRNTSMANYLGLCAITLPVGSDALGLPVGLQLIARANQEPRLLSIALAIEKTLGTGQEILGDPPRRVEIKQ